MAVTHPTPAPGGANPDREPELAAWQSRLLPLMAGLLLFLTVFFIVATLVQAWRMQQRIEEVGRSIPSVVGVTQLGDEGGLTFEHARWDAMVRLEQYAIRSRYQQASLILMSRVWIIYLGFVTGMILALVGAAFILGKLREPVSELGTESSFLKISIASASPGLILAVLGTALMLTTIIIRAEVSVTDAPLYVGPAVRVTGGGFRSATIPPPADVPDAGDTSGSQPPDDSELDELDNEVRSSSSEGQ